MPLEHGSGRGQTRRIGRAQSSESAKGKAFLKSLVSLCREFGVESIAGMVAAEKGLKFIRECGVQYVQGYLFGKTNRGIKTFEKLRRPALFPQWRG